MKLEEELAELLKSQHLQIATAESCTGGLLSSKLTDVSGSSEYIKLNYVTYSNNSKHNILGVSWDILNTYGAVSEECAYEMALGLQNITSCDISLCTTGIAGPSGGSQVKPVGLMYASTMYKGIITVKKILISNDYDRISIKNKFADEALKLAISILRENRI